MRRQADPRRSTPQIPIVTLDVAPRHPLKPAAPFTTPAPLSIRNPQ
jgi:hypothetical protein